MSKKEWGQSKTIDTVSTPSTRQRNNRRLLEENEDTPLVPVIVAKDAPKKPMPMIVKSIIVVVVVLVVVAGAVLIIALIRGNLVKSAKKKGKNTIDVSEFEELDGDSPGMDEKYKINKTDKEYEDIHMTHHEDYKGNPKTPSYRNLPSATEVARDSPEPHDDIETHEQILEPEESRIEQENPQEAEISGDTDGETTAKTVDEDLTPF